MAATTDKLEPIEPERAQELYLKHKATECTEATVQSHKYQTNQFVRWCTEKDLDNLNELTGRDLHEFRLWRQEDGDLKKISLNMEMSTLRVFLRWCGSIEAVPQGLCEKVMVPSVRAEDERRDESLDADLAQDILGYLGRFHYASVEHVVFALLWETGIRIGAAHSLDVGDFHPQEERLDLVHRPDQGTHLKNGTGGERPIALSTELTEWIEEYLGNIRNEVRDEYDRRPLITTTHGRMVRTTIRRSIYRVTAPCFRNEPCPGCSGKSRGKCDEAVSPHAIRRGSITHFLTNDVPVEVVGDRMNVSRDVVDKHYDKRSEKVKLEQRRGYLSNV